MYIYICIYIYIYIYILCNTYIYVYTYIARLVGVFGRKLVLGKRTQGVRVRVNPNKYTQTYTLTHYLGVVGGLSPDISIYPYMSVYTYINTHLYKHIFISTYL